MNYALRLLMSLLISCCLRGYCPAQADVDFQQLVDRHFSATEQAAAASGLSAATYMSDAERAVISSVNLARLYPQQFDGMYMEWLQTSNADDGWEKLQSGDPYFASLHADLQQLKPLPAMHPSKKYWRAARFWARYSGKRGLVGHNRPWYPVRFQAEVCAYNPSADPMTLIMDLLVDEKVKGLGHRKILLGKWLSAGASLQPHARYGWCLVIDFGE